MTSRHLNRNRQPHKVQLKSGTSDGGWTGRVITFMKLGDGKNEPSHMQNKERLSIPDDKILGVEALHQPKGRAAAAADAAPL
jgi:hypothetical protein